MRVALPTHPLALPCAIHTLRPPSHVPTGPHVPPCNFGTLMARKRHHKMKNDVLGRCSPHQGQQPHPLRLAVLMCVCTPRSMGHFEGVPGGGGGGGGGVRGLGGLGGTRGGHVSPCPTSFGHLVGEVPPCKGGTGGAGVGWAMGGPRGGNQGVGPSQWDPMALPPPSPLMLDRLPKP